MSNPAPWAILSSKYDQRLQVVISVLIRYPTIVAIRHRETNGVGPMVLIFNGFHILTTASATSEP
jgi:hypothetical protein